MRATWCVCAAVLMTSTAAAQRAGDIDLLDEALARTGRRVEEYYARARTIVATERVLIQPLSADLLSTGLGRRLVYELRVEWEPPLSGEPAGTASVVRRLLSVNGRPPEPGAEP